MALYLTILIAIRKCCPMGKFSETEIKNGDDDK